MPLRNDMPPKIQQKQQGKNSQPVAKLEDIILKYTSIKEFDNSKSIGEGLKTLTINSGAPTSAVAAGSA